jgi:hypothetical protein
MNDNPVSAFDQGSAAARVSGSVVENPFLKGSAEHNNFEVGRRFGATQTKPSSQALIVDEDEEGN